VVLRGAVIDVKIPELQPPAIPWTTRRQRENCVAAGREVTRTVTKTRRRRLALNERRNRTAGVDIYLHHPPYIHGLCRQPYTARRDDEQCDDDRTRQFRSFAVETHTSHMHATLTAMQ